MNDSERTFKTIVIGIEEYEDPSWKTLEGVSRIAARVAKIFGEKPLLLRTGGNIDEVDDELNKVIDHVTPRATLFVHWIGHGVSMPTGHYLICRDSPGPSELRRRRAIGSSELGEILAQSDAERVVLVLDTCFSGAGAGDVAEEYRNIMAASLDREGWQRVVCVIASSHPLDKAVAGRFSEGLADALEHPEKHNKWSKGDECLIPEEIVEAVVVLLDKERSVINPQSDRKGYISRIIPNPLYKPAAGNTDIETSRSLEGVFGEEAHFNLASRGIETGEAGYFFSGRRRSQEQIISWLNDRHASLMVVTGPPGTGKSALLGRVVTLSVPDIRAEVNQAGGLSKEDPVPPDNSVDVAVHAKGKNVFQVATALGRMVGFDREIGNLQGIADVVAKFKEASSPLDEEESLKPLTIVIDALDEAASKQAQRIANELIRPLATLPNVRLLVGTRRSLDGGLMPEGETKHSRLVNAFGPGAVILDLENEPETQADIAEFVAKRLRGVAEDQRGSGPWIEAAAEKVASAANGSFLYARLVSRSLEAARGAPLEAMPTDASAAFVEDIAARFPGDQKRVTDMLRALAFALGLGLSRAVWAPVATALDDAGDTYDDDDIIWMLRHVGSYIVETTVVTDGIGQAVYRLIHQALADHLQGEVAKAQTRIVDALCRGLEGEVWLGADSYLRRHLVEHAVLADQEWRVSVAKDDPLQSSFLEKLISTPGVLAISQPASVLTAQVHLLSEKARGSLGVYLLCAPQLPELSPVERWALLHLRAWRQAEQALAEAWQPPKSSPWRCVWARTRPVTPHLNLGGHAYDSIARFSFRSSGSSVALGEVEGRAVIVSGGADSTVRLWDAKAGTPIGVPLTGHQGGVSSVALGEVEGRAVIVSGGDDSTVQLWDANAGTPIGEPLTGHQRSVNSVALGKVNGRTVIVSGGADSTVRLWDAKAGTPIGEPLTGHQGSVRTVALGEVEGRAVIVSGGDDSTVRLWDAKAGTPIGDPFTGHHGSVSSVAVWEVDGWSVIVSGGRDSTVRLWDATGGTPICEPLTYPRHAVNSIALGQLNGQPVIVSGGLDNTVLLWDAKAGTPIGEPLTGHWHEVSSVALGEVDGRTVIVSGSRDNSVRVWDVGVITPNGSQLTGHQGRVRSAALGEIDGRTVIVSGGGDRTLRLWDAKAGTPIGEPLTGHHWVISDEEVTGGVYAVALGEIDGRAVIVSGGADSTVRRWDAKTGTPIGEPLTHHQSGVRSVAMGEVEGRAVIVSGGRDGTVRRWDAKAGTPIGEPLTGHWREVSSVALGEVDGRTVIVSGGADSTVRRWDAKTGTPIGGPLTGHQEGVNSVALGEVEGRAVIVSGGGDRTVRLWDAKAGTPIGEPLTGPKDGVWNGTYEGIYAVALGEIDGRAVIISGGDDMTVRRWNLAASSSSTTIPLDEHVWEVVACPGGRMIIGTDRDLIMIEFHL